MELMPKTWTPVLHSKGLISGEKRDKSMFGTQNKIIFQPALFSGDACCASLALKLSETHPLTVMTTRRT
jgi:hypothetical protein